MYTIINGSPKPQNSNSKYFLREIFKEDKIYELKKDNYDEIIQNINNTNIIVLSFPLYVDSPPSITLKFLDYIIDENINLKEKKLYLIINCGFKEGEQNITARNIIKNWCRKTHIEYMGSLLIGSGETQRKKRHKIISYPTTKKLKKLKNKISKKEKFTDEITTISIIGNKLYCFIANNWWTRKGRKNKLRIDEIKAK